MGNIAQSIRRALTIVDDVTTAGGITVDVVHRAYVAQDALGDGEPYAAPVTRQAVFKDIKHQFHGVGGYEVQSQGHLLFARPVTITTSDQLTMPDGTTPPILEVNGVWDSEAGRRYYTVVTLGQESLPRQQFGN